MIRLARTCRLLLALFFFPISGWAQWTVTSRQGHPLAPGVELTRVQLEQNGRTAELILVTAEVARQTLAVLDDPAGELRVASAGPRLGALAAVNGGYFQPDRTPLGLVIAGGKTLHSLEHAKLLSGLVVADGSRVALLRVGEYKPAASVRAALQAGPFLVDRGAAVTGLNATRSAARTAVFTATPGLFGLVHCPDATLAEAGALLATQGLIPGHPLQRALNLDGGTSSGLWVRPPGGGSIVSEWKTVRNYLGIVAR